MEALGQVAPAPGELVQLLSGLDAFGGDDEPEAVAELNDPSPGGATRCHFRPRIRPARSSKCCCDARHSKRGLRSDHLLYGGPTDPQPSVCDVKGITQGSIELRSLHLVEMTGRRGIENTLRDGWAAVAVGHAGLWEAPASANL